MKRRIVDFARNLVMMLGLVFVLWLGTSTVGSTLHETRDLETHEATTKQLEEQKRDVVHKIQGEDSVSKELLAKGIQEKFAEGKELQDEVAKAGKGRDDEQETKSEVSNQLADSEEQQRGVAVIAGQTKNENLRAAETFQCKLFIMRL